MYNDLEQSRRAQEAISLLKQDFNQVGSESELILITSKQELSDILLDRLEISGYEVSKFSFDKENMRLELTKETNG